MTKASLSGLAFLIDLAEREGSAGRLCRPRSTARLRRLRAPLENGLRRFLSSAPSRVRIHARATKKRATGPASSLNLAEREGFAGRRAPPSLRCAPAPLAGFAGKRSAFPQLRTLAGSNPCAGNKKAGRSGPLLISTWRRERDSNPRNTCVLNGFQDRRIQPLCHLSGALGNDSIERDVTCAGFARAVREVRGCRDEASR